MVSQRESKVQPDLAILIVAAARVVADVLGPAVAAAGVEDIRPQFGFVLRAAGENGVTLTELADRLAMTKQAAIKVVDEMERRGLVERRAHPEDRRAKLIAPTERGLLVRKAALMASRRMERDLRRVTGDADVDALRRALAELLGRHGGLEDALAGRARPVW
jgi:DNA-binding MarR family transcriptional regulator